ncbi:serine/threonine protein kinase [Pyxidicoccus parkwayensis]|uniref:Serine/threonine protein kinase n=1 Tax=Pyxidicoccus parkwayensis TaxID=2813578 RepID=A0ABX7NYD9_9BACT|nr:serine/threonine-protein kinase [Pyxidicoccus parkwaysis]QSQ22411.1 serine/threonine protein kinase [Pyxidicoccus parkwaysis]
MTQASPRPFGRYVLHSLLSSSNFAEVWLAHGPVPGRVALKRYLPYVSEDADLVELLMTEARRTLRLFHPNIARVHECGEHDGYPYVVMEYVHGERLDTVVARARSRGQPLTPALALHIAARVCAGLDHAHGGTDEHGHPSELSHQSISLENILIGHDGAVKLVGFGRRQRHVEALNMATAGVLKDPIATLAPEQLAHKAVPDARVDIFSTGRVLYELLTGVNPFQRATELESLNAVMECKPAPPSTLMPVSPALDLVVMKALDLAPDARYRDARQFQQSLEELIASNGWTEAARPESLSRWMQHASRV